MTPFLPSDIARCQGDDCPLKEGCLRYLAPAVGEWQPWIIPPPVVGGECEYEIPVGQNLRVFGTVLRAARLGWAWYEEGKCYVRISPRPQVLDGAIVEFARSFAALSCGSDRGECYALRQRTPQELRDLLEMCAATERALACPDDYQRYEVDDEGRLTT